jgi:DNA-binding NtrC family response regulator
MDIAKPLDFENLDRVARNAVECREVKKPAGQSGTESSAPTIIGKSQQMQELILKVDKLAGKRVPSILITGESGTGKELIAKALHFAGVSSMNPFFSISCSALLKDHCESELFGCDRNRFSGVDEPERGMFELADSGTLMFDEIGDMDMHFQSELSPVLETRTIRRIGSTRRIYFDVMVIATTNKDLGQMMHEGTFRSDLYYRLSPFSLKVPSLRERKEDIPLLAEYFLEQFRSGYGRPSVRMSRDAMGVLTSYSWPGNVRELKGLLANIMLMEDEDLIIPDHILPRLESGAKTDQLSNIFDASLSLEDVEKNMLQQALLKSNGNMAQAARMLNIGYEKIRYKIRKFGI